MIYAIAFSRAFTTSLVGVLMGTYLGRVGLSGESIGAVVSAGLLGSALAMLTAILTGDRIGRRRFLVAVGTLGALGALGLAAARNHPFVMVVVSFAGMVNGMGRDRGAALALEQAILPATATDDERTRVLAWYTALQDLGHALGALATGIPALLAAHTSLEGTTPHRVTLASCALIGMAGVALYGTLGPAIDAGAPRERAPIRPSTKRVLLRISALFAVDGVAGGFLTTTLLSFFFFRRFGASEGWIGALFFGARLLNALSHLGAAWLAKRIGLVNTMVFTHMPSSLLLVTVAFAPSFPIAAALFLLREGLVEMDVPTRTSYVLAVVLPEERTVAAGVTNLVRLVAWAIAPIAAGRLMTGSSMYVPLVIGAAMKVAYDVLLYVAFRGTRPPEEREPTSAAGSAATERRAGRRGRRVTSR